ncbi:hypothetical protein Anapl_16101 [Anas platyrhynchos]|uniref:Uncharacterized protein n=1 Tax=Anas platyrhynchos TaxID=8839 RepID=R0JNY5_ANAPL|nr:hypothetical protein Anapl_16101 [Anas platyrhynchos]
MPSSEPALLPVAALGCLCRALLQLKVTFKMPTITSKKALHLAKSQPYYRSLGAGVNLISCQVCILAPPVQWSFSTVTSQKHPFSSFQFNASCVTLAQRTVLKCAAFCKPFFLPSVYQHTANGIVFPVDSESVLLPSLVTAKKSLCLGQQDVFFCTVPDLTWNSHWIPKHDSTNNNTIFAQLPQAVPVLTELLDFLVQMGMAFALKKFKNGAFKWDFEVILYMNFANSLMRDRRLLAGEEVPGAVCREPFRTQGVGLKPNDLFGLAAGTSGCSGHRAQGTSPIMGQDLSLEEEGEEEGEEQDRVPSPCGFRNFRTLSTGQLELGRLKRNTLDVGEVLSKADPLSELERWERSKSKNRTLDNTHEHRLLRFFSGIFARKDGTSTLFGSPHGRSPRSSFSRSRAYFSSLRRATVDIESSSESIDGSPHKVHSRGKQKEAEVK